MYDPGPYSVAQPTPQSVEALRGRAVLELGTDWCGHCMAARPHVEAALSELPDVVHIKVEDGPGRPLGRSFGVVLWPTLIVLQDGREVARVVRPKSAAVIREALRRA